MTERIELLMNGESRKALLAQREVVDSLARHNLTINKVHIASKKVTIDSIVSEILSAPPTLLIVGGGDGTVSSVLDKLIGSNIEIGIVPLGTTNNFARSLALPLNLDEAIEHIRISRAKSVDLGKLNDTYFTNVASIGLSAMIASNVTDMAKRRFGRLAYALQGLHSLFSHKPFFVTIQDIDHELSVTFETHQVVIANGRYHSGKEIAEEARVDNGKLIIFALGGRSKLSFIKHVVDFYVGKRKKIVHQSYFMGRNVEITTSSAQVAELDGEVKLWTPLHAKVEKAALKVRY